MRPLPSHLIPAYSVARMARWRISQLGDIVIGQMSNLLLGQVNDRPPISTGSTDDKDRLEWRVLCLASSFHNLLRLVLSVGFMVFNSARSIAVIWGIVEEKAIPHQIGEGRKVAPRMIGL